MFSFHCNVHIINLSLNDAISAELPRFFLRFVRGINSYFSRSAERAGELTEEFNALVDTWDVHGVDLVHPK